MQRLAGIAITLVVITGASAGSAPPDESANSSADDDCPTGMSRLFLGRAPMLQANCELLLPGYAEQTRADFGSWQRIWSRCLGPHFGKDMASYRLQAASQIPRLSEAEKQSTVAACRVNVFDLATSVRPAKPEYSAPEATWTEFRAALRARDKPRTLLCFVSAGSQSGKVVDAMSSDDLEKLEKSLTDIKRTANTTPAFVEAIMERQAAAAAEPRNFTVRFVDVNGNWLIESL